MPTDRPGPSGPRATFGYRFVAALVDGILLGIVNLVLREATSPGGGYGLGLLVSLAYFTFFEGSASGQTIGKRAIGIRVVDLPGGGSIGHGRALVRWVGRIISSIPLLLGYFWMLWDRERQTWHDKLASAVVVPVADFPVERWPG